MDSMLVLHVDSSFLNTGMRKSESESSKKDESRAQSVDSSKAYRKGRVLCSKPEMW